MAVVSVVSPCGETGVSRRGALRFQWTYRMNRSWISTAVVRAGEFRWVLKGFGTGVGIVDMDP